MFEYNICNRADAELFYKQCEALEKRIPNLHKQELLDDVDGTLVQKYVHFNGAVTVKSDSQVDALYVCSDFDLIPYFKN